LEDSVLGKKPNRSRLTLSGLKTRSFSISQISLYGD